MATQVVAAPYAAMVIDARTGEVLHSRNADTPLHPASLTKMMTLYIAFQAIEAGEISADATVTISANAAAEPPSKLGLRAGQQIKLRYLIRAAAIKSANDAATAIGEAISGSEAAFAQRMNITAAALGMTNTHFENMHGLTASGHLSTARDMANLGRHLFYDYPDYYNLFSRRTADVGGRSVRNTNRLFLDAYRGADGIKTGYTSASGYNLVGSAQRGQERIIAALFGASNSVNRANQMAELLNMGFQRAPSSAPIRKPGRPDYNALMANVARGTTSTVRVALAVQRSPRPQPRPMAEPPAALLAAIEGGIESTLAGVVQTAEVVGIETPPERPDELVIAEGSDEAPADIVPAEETVLAAADLPAEAPTPMGSGMTVIDETLAADVDSALASVAEDLSPEVESGDTVDAPPPRPKVILAALAPREEPATATPEVVTRMSSSGGRHWSINVGRYTTEFEAERVLLRTALSELSTLGEALRKVNRTPRGWEANFVGLTQDSADMACRRLEARDTACSVVGPS